MPLPTMNVFITEMIARTIVIGGLSYFLLDGKIQPPELYDHFLVGGTGAFGSIISQSYVEGPVISMS